MMTIIWREGNVGDACNDNTAAAEIETIKRTLMVKGNNKYQKIDSAKTSLMTLTTLTRVTTAKEHPK